MIGTVGDERVCHKGKNLVDEFFILVDRQDFVSLFAKFTGDVASIASQSDEKNGFHKRPLCRMQIIVSGQPMVSFPSGIRLAKCDFLLCKA